MRNEMPRNVEYAGTGGGPLPDEVLRVKLRNAPAWVLADVEAYRETRNLPPLFGKRTAAIVTKAPTRQARPTKPVATVSGTLVAAAAPGVSWPTAITKRGIALPETISHAAWRRVCNSLRNGKHVPITLNHGGKTICTTGSPRFRFLHHDVAGLVFELDMMIGETPVPHGSGVSIGFRNARHHEAFLDGKRCRVIDELELRHIAILMPETGDVPAYRLARVKRAMPGHARDAVIDTVIDIGFSIKREWPSLLKQQ